MLAFRGQMHALDGELTDLRERLKDFEGASKTMRLDPKKIKPSRWANRHSTSFATAAFAGLKNDIEQAGGNVQPILVRPLEGQAGQYEIVFGHRRHRACLELGIQVLASIWADTMGDVELFMAMDRENREREDLSAYEQGMMYQRALEEGLFPSQRQLAERLGVTHTWVRKTIVVAQLPQAVVDCFRSPLEIQYRMAEAVAAALERDSRAVLRRAEKIRGQRLASAAVVNALVGSGPGRQEKIDLQVQGKNIGSCVRGKGGAFKINLLAGSTSDECLDTLVEALRAMRG